MRLQSRLARLERTAGELAPSLMVQMEYLDRGGRLVSALLTDGRMVGPEEAEWLPRWGHLALAGVDPDVVTGRKPEAEFNMAYLRE